MLIASSFNKGLFRYVDVAYLLKFLLLLVFLYYFNLFFIGIVTEGGGLYSSFLAKYLNYINWIRGSILYASNVIAHAFGLPSYVAESYILKVAGGASVLMAFQCIGLGVMSFWTAFITAHKGKWQHKLVWCLGGLAAIWFINSWRVALLLLALERRWKTFVALDHHTTFNIAAYCLILTLIYFYIRKEKSRVSK